MLGIAVDKLREKIGDAIRESGLPPIVVESVVGCYYFQLQAMSAEQIQKEKAAIDAERKEIKDGREKEKV